MTALSDKIRRLQEQVERADYARRKTSAQSTVGHVQQDVTALHIFLFRFYQACVWIYQEILDPIARRMRQWFVRFVWHPYRRLWDKVVYVPDGFGGTRFSKVRAGVLVLATGFIIYIADDLALLAGDAALFAATEHQEDLYLVNSQEIVPKYNTHSASGCHDLPCTDHNSIYFRIRPTWFNHLWAIYHTGYLFFPDYVAAAVPPVVSKCHITSYGIRIKFVMRQMDIYPDLLSVSCAPVFNQG